MKKLYLSGFMSPLFLHLDKRDKNVVPINNGEDDLMGKLTNKRKKGANQSSWLFTLTAIVSDGGVSPTERKTLTIL